jgi:uncharacterized membrane protein YgcG
MFGVIIGVVLGVILAFADVTSWWWVLWFAMIGFVCEIIVRFGFGEELADCVGSSVEALSSIDWGGSDSGGGGSDYSSSGDCGGGGDSGGGGD